jgi:hypothetical protein
MCCVAVVVQGGSKAAMPVLCPRRVPLLAPRAHEPADFVQKRQWAGLGDVDSIVLIACLLSSVLSKTWPAVTEATRVTKVQEAMLQLAKPQVDTLVRLVTSFGSLRTLCWLHRLSGVGPHFRHSKRADTCPYPHPF